VKGPLLKAAAGPLPLEKVDQKVILD